MTTLLAVYLTGAIVTGAITWVTSGHHDKPREYWSLTLAWFVFVPLIVIVEAGNRSGELTEDDEA